MQKPKDAQNGLKLSSNTSIWGLDKPCTHHLRLPHTTFYFLTPPTTCTHPANVSPGLSMSLPAYPRLSRPTHVYPSPPTSIPASQAYPEREKNINCLEIEGEYHVMLRCYARRFLSDDSFAEIAEDFVIYIACRLSLTDL